MSNLLEVAELAWRQLFPDPSDLPTITKGEFVASARHLFASEVLAKYFSERRSEGYSEVPSLLLHENDFNVVNNEVDLNSISALQGMPNDMWLQRISSPMGCRYIKSSLNLSQSIGDDDCIGTERTYYLVGKKVRFPQGADSTVNITYAGLGKKVDDSIEVDSDIAGTLRIRLIELYGGKSGKEDVTNNSNSNE